MIFSHLVKCTLLSTNEFCKQFGVQRQTLYNYVSNRTTPPVELTMQVINYLDQLRIKAQDNPTTRQEQIYASIITGKWSYKPTSLIELRSVHNLSTDEYNFITRNDIDDDDRCASLVEFNDYMSEGLTRNEALMKFM